MNNTPHPVDVHVGKRIRHRRWMNGTTQQQLAEKVGIKFQQIQKYETGMNRVSASRLWDIAHALGVDVSFFFEELKLYYFFDKKVYNSRVFYKLDKDKRFHKLVYDLESLLTSNQRNQFFKMTKAFISAVGGKENAHS